MRGAFVQQETAGGGKFLVREPDLQPHGIARGEVEACAEVRVGGQKLRAERFAALRQLLRRQYAEVAPDDQLRIAVEAAAAHEAVFVLGKCDGPAGRRCAVGQIEQVQQRQRVPVGERRLDRAVRQTDGDRLPQRRDLKRAVSVPHAGFFRNVLRRVPRQSRPRDGEHAFKLTIFHALTSPPS